MPPIPIDDATLKVVATPAAAVGAALVALMGVWFTNSYTTKRLKEQLDHATTLHDDKLAKDKIESAKARIFEARRAVYADVCAASVAASNYLSNYGQQDLLNPSPPTAISDLQASVAKMVVLSEPATANTGMTLAGKYADAFMHLFNESLKLKMAKQRMDEVYADKTNTDTELIDEVFATHKRLTYEFMEECTTTLEALTEPQIALASAMRSDLGASSLELAGMETIMRQASENLKRGKKKMVTILEEVEQEYR